MQAPTGSSTSPLDERDKRAGAFQKRASRLVEARVGGRAANGRAVRR